MFFKKKQHEETTLSSMDLFISTLDVCKIAYNLYDIDDSHFCTINSMADDSYLTFEFDNAERFVKVD